MIMYFRVQNVCDDIPGVGHLLSSFIPTPGNLPPKTKKSANARGLARGGGWAQLELTDAFHLHHTNIQSSVNGLVLNQSLIYNTK